MPELTSFLSLDFYWIYSADTPPKLESLENKRIISWALSRINFHYKTYFYESCLQVCHWMFCISRRKERFWLVLGACYIYLNCVFFLAPDRVLLKIRLCGPSGIIKCLDVLFNNVWGVWYVPRNFLSSLTYPSRILKTCKRTVIAFWEACEVCPNPFRETTQPIKIVSTGLWTDYATFQDTCVREVALALLYRAGATSLGNWGGVPPSLSSRDLG